MHQYKKQTMQASKEMKTAFLLLEDGTLLKGKAFGKIGTSGGELCFNTGMTGYQEVFTDPSYAGQVLIMNTAYVGNYGVNDTDIESKGVKIRALICKNITDRFSRFTATQSLSDYLLDNDIVAIQDIDTRALVNHVRNKGAMNCVISSELTSRTELQQALDSIPKMEGLELGSIVSTDQAYTFGNEDAPYRVSILDFGVKQSMLQNMADRGLYVKVFPARSTIEELNTFNPDAYFVSNGPGDPAAMDYAVQTVKDIIVTDKPMFGICLGHQLLARANGIGTYKMHHGHRGLNHPVLNIKTGKSEITTQNHGFGIKPEDVEKASNIVEVTHRNLNDDSIEGIRMKNKPAFSVQYHPESTPGPFDSRYLFDEFISLIEKQKN